MLDQSAFGILNHVTTMFKYQTPTRHALLAVQKRALCVYTASLLDSAILSVAACAALAEIGRRNALPLQGDNPSCADKLTTDENVALTTAVVVEKLINKVQSTSETAKVWHMPWNLEIVVHSPLCVFYLAMAISRMHTAEVQRWRRYPASLLTMVAGSVTSVSRAVIPAVL